MSSDLDVISDFLDGESFEPHALGQALAQAEGREFLVACLALRQAVHVDEVAMVGVPGRKMAPRSRLALLWTAAAILVALAGGYQLGIRQVEGVSREAPAAVRAVPVNWQSLPEENVR
jgi:hypothetical protein